MAQGGELNMCTVNEESPANETDLAPGRGRGPAFPGSRPWKKRRGSTFLTVPNTICLCSQICPYSNVAINEVTYGPYIAVVSVGYSPENRS